MKIKYIFWAGLIYIEKSNGFSGGVQGFLFFNQAKPEALPLLKIGEADNEDEM